MKITKIIIGLLAVCLLSFSLQANSGRNHRYHHNNDLLWIGAGAAVLTAAAIAASENDNRDYNCRVVYRDGSYRNGYFRSQNQACIVGNRAYYQDYDLLD